VLCCLIVILTVDSEHRNVRQRQDVTSSPASSERLCNSPPSRSFFSPKSQVFNDITNTFSNNIKSELGVSPQCCSHNSNVSHFNIPIVQPPRTKSVPENTFEVPQRRRGRPPGSKNKIKSRSSAAIGLQDNDENINPNICGSGLTANGTPHTLGAFTLIFLFFIITLCYSKN